MCKKNLIRLGVAALGAALSLPGMAMAGHYSHGGYGSVTTITHSTSTFRPGPPPHARAHGHRNKHDYRHHSRHPYRGHRYPSYSYYEPVHRAPVYRAPATVYHAPSHSSLDFTVRYRTQF
ncbi:MAG: hypothetical protein ABR558_01470 [Thioalkalivibrio sp.]